MSNKIVLVSDDSDFFDYIKLKLELRGSDELVCYTFAEIPGKIQDINTSVLIINSENSQEKTLDILSFFNCVPIIVMAYNEDTVFINKCHRAGMLYFIPIMTKDSEFRAKLIPAFEYASLLKKNKFYRNILFRHKFISEYNEVFTNYDEILDIVLDKIKKTSAKGVFLAISPNSNSKFLITQNEIETILLNNLRQEDIVMTYAPNKYFVVLFDSDIKFVKKIWAKIESKFSQKMYSSIINIGNKNKLQLINESIYKLNNIVNIDNLNNSNDNEQNSNDEYVAKNNTGKYVNFKLYRQEIMQKIDKITSPAFYRIQQKYMEFFSGVRLEQSSANGQGIFRIVRHNTMAEFKITSPGLENINIDICLFNNDNCLDSKRVNLTLDEFEEGLLNDLLEQFVSDFKNFVCKN